ncbi:MAG TPA: ferrous iron transporter B, partial [Methanoregula sp.]|nr:ferrous iron transporter B [Methanoregula sp.]
MSGQVSAKQPLPEDEYVVALAGNANVGKSVTFNQLTGVDQDIGNWPGKTVERAEGILRHQGRRIRVIDLPGIYSIAALSTEEQISREFIAHDNPDVVVNIVDASALERNLFFTLQLMELESPLIVAVNQMDLAAKKGIHIDIRKLSALLGIPVIPMVAIQGKGIAELSDTIVDAILSRPEPHTITYGREVEDRITRIQSRLPPRLAGYPSRWTAIKLLEGDPDAVWETKKLAPEAAAAAQVAGGELENLHGESPATIMSAERYHAAERLVAEVTEIQSPRQTGISFTERIDRIALHPVLGYLLLSLMIGGAPGRERMASTIVSDNSAIPLPWMATIGITGIPRSAE